MDFEDLALPVFYGERTEAKAPKAAGRRARGTTTSKTKSSSAPATAHSMTVAPHERSLIKENEGWW